MLPVTSKITYTKQENGSYKIYYYNDVFVGEFYMEVDGYYVFESVLKSGYIPGHLLLSLGNKLEELNKEWDDNITEYFNKQKIPGDF